MKEKIFFPEQEQAVLGLIQNSLYRCEHSGIPSWERALPEVSAQAKEECVKHVSGHTLLIRESSPVYYARLTEALDLNEALLMYVASNMDVYARYGNKKLKEELKTVNLRFGTNLSEEYVGTNAAALSAKSAGAVWTIGEQNYARALQPYAFFAFTVHARYNRCVHILLATRVDNLSPAVLGLFRLIEATESVFSSGMLTQDVILKDAIFRDNYSDKRTENMLILVGNGGKITYANNIFYEMFKTDYGKVLNLPLEKVVPELEYVLKDLQENADPPQPRQLRFEALGPVDYYVSCTKANQQMAGGGIAVTVQRMLFQERRGLRHEDGAKYSFNDLVGVSEKFEQLKLFAERVAATDCTVLIRGESGTGKELFAHSLHNASDRCDKPFISVNCAAIPRELIGSELFGYVGGAFTGANRGGAKGKFELAHGGTLFLDEIGEMPTDMQSVLLRVLEERAITRIGGSKPVPVDVRLIVATNQNLEDYIREGKFRLDLFYRLNIISLNMIPLRERREDIDPLADSFVIRFSKQHAKPCDGISLEARNALRAYDWPGNVRELRNVIERGVITTNTRFVELHHLPPEILGELSPPSLRENGGDSLDLNRHIADYRFEAVERLMREYDGNKSKVAKKMGIARTTLYRILKEMQKQKK